MAEKRRLAPGRGRPTREDQVNNFSSTFKCIMLEEGKKTVILEIWSNFFEFIKNRNGKRFLA